MSANSQHAAHAVNALGLDLHRQMPKQGNLCLSPYSIQSALAMAYLGASGATQEEMARVLHFNVAKNTTAASFAALREELDAAQEASARMVTEMEKYVGPGEAATLHAANRLFGQQGYDFRESFMSQLRGHFAAPLQAMNFVEDADGARLAINAWVEQQTRDRIRDLVPAMALSEVTRLVLVNALYFKAAWADEFEEHATSPQPFHMAGGKKTAEVPMMMKNAYLGHYVGGGFRAVTLPYVGHQVHCLLIVPDDVDGVAGIEDALTPETLLACAKAGMESVILRLPKFRITPPTMPLGKVLQRMGMTTAFDRPRGSADFEAMATKRTEDYLCLAEVFHKTLIEIDEKGTEAAAATAAMAVAGGAGTLAKPFEVNADRPFLFAIQHSVSGACLFLGRVSDPR